MQGITTAPKIQVTQQRTDSEVAALARAYALILSWSPKVEESTEKDTEENTTDNVFAFDGNEKVGTDEYVDN